MIPLLPALYWACATSLPPGPPADPPEPTPAVDTEVATTPSPDSEPVDSEPIDPTPVDTMLTCVEGEPCFGVCVDPLTDPFNCGGCGRTCVIPGAEAACTEGRCALTGCTEGLADCDGLIGNGCERAVDCAESAACTTTCGSQGITRCGDGCAPTCEAPVESCNALDDDCDGLCDEVLPAGCRVGVHRAFGPLGHDYGPDANNLTARGATIEAYDYWKLYATGVAGTRPLFRCNKGNGSRFLTTATDCEGSGVPEIIVGFLAASPTCSSTPLYRLLNAAAGHHFYTLSAPERDFAVQTLGFTDEGVAGYVWP